MLAGDRGSVGGGIKWPSSPSRPALSRGVAQELERQLMGISSLDKSSSWVSVTLIYRSEGSALIVWPNSFRQENNYFLHVLK